MDIKRLRRNENYEVFIDAKAQLVLIKVLDVHDNERVHEPVIDSLMPNRDRVFSSKSIVDCRNKITNSEKFGHVKLVKEGYDFEIYAYRPKPTHLKAAVIRKIYRPRKRPDGSVEIVDAYYCVMENGSRADISEEELYSSIRYNVYNFVNARIVGESIEVMSHDFSNERDWIDRNGYDSDYCNTLYTIFEKIDKFNDKQKEAVKKLVREYVSDPGDINDLDDLFLNPRNWFPYKFRSLDTLVRDRAWMIFEKCHLYKEN